MQRSKHRVRIAVVGANAGAVHREVAVVVGLGPVGLLTSLLLARAGARVLAAAPRSDRRAVAAALGIDARPPELLASGVDELTGGRGVPLLVELSGSPPALADALALLAHEGTALVGSWYGTQPVLLPLGGAFHRRRLAIRSSQVSSIRLLWVHAGTSGAAAPPFAGCWRSCRCTHCPRGSSRSRRRPPRLPRSTPVKLVWCMWRCATAGTKTCRRRRYDRRRRYLPWEQLGTPTVAFIPADFELPADMRCRQTTAIDVATVPVRSQGFPGQ